jgi:DNA-binding transcriptional ArsR family regulator
VVDAAAAESIAQMTSAQIDHTLVALADPTRRRVVDLLRKKPRRAGDIAAALSVSPPLLSRHLRVLRKSGLIENSEVEHDARVRVYRLRPEPTPAGGWAQIAPATAFVNSEAWSHVAQIVLIDPFTVGVGVGVTTQNGNWL